MSITAASLAALINNAARGNLKSLRDLLTEFASYVADITAGTVTASQAVVVSATKTIGTFLSITATTFIGNPRIPVAAVNAAGTNLATATQLANGFSVVALADDAVGVKLPATPTAGDIVIVKSTVSNKILKVYPDAAATINAIGANGAISLASGPTPAIFIASSATQWYTIPLLPS